MQVLWGQVETLGCRLGTLTRAFWGIRSEAWHTFGLTENVEYGLNRWNHGGDILHRFGKAITSKSVAREFNQFPLR